MHSVLKVRAQRRHLAQPRLKVSPASVANDAVGAPEWREPDIGVVCAGRHAEFRAGCEHAVWLGDALGYEVVNHDADVCVAAADYHLRFSERREAGIDTSDDPLCGCFLVPSRAVYLTGEEEAGNGLCFKCCAQVSWVNVVVFDAIAWLQHDRFFEARDSTEEGALNGFRDRHGDAVGVDGGISESFGLEPYDVRWLVGEADDFGFERGAVAWAFDSFSDVDGFVEVLSEEVVGGRRGRGGVAEELFVDLDARVEVGEGHRWIITVLWEEVRVVDGASVDARRRAGFQTSHFEAGGFEGG